MIISNLIKRISNITNNVFNGLRMGIIEKSLDEKKNNININFKSKDMTGSTPISQVERRTFEELENLLWNSIEFSNKKVTLKCNIKIIRPKKVYKMKVKLIKKYTVIAKV